MIGLPAAERRASRCFPKASRAFLEQLEGLPQPVVILVEVLLEKTPWRRFQAPAELLKVMPAITGAIDGGRTITPLTIPTPQLAARHHDWDPRKFQ